jgi:hypothetical protein
MLPNPPVPKPKRAYLLKALETTELTLLMNILENQRLELAIPCQRAHTRGHPLLLGPLGHHTLLWHNHGHQCALQTVAVDKRLRHILGAHIDILDLLRRNILTLLQLENVLDPVDDLQRAIPL